MNKLLLLITMLCALPCGAMQKPQFGAQLKLPNIPGVITPQKFCRTTLECSDGKLLVDNNKLNQFAVLSERKQIIAERSIPVDDSLETMKDLFGNPVNAPKDKVINVFLACDKYAAPKKVLKDLAQKIIENHEDEVEKNVLLKNLLIQLGKIKTQQQLVFQKKISSGICTMSIIGDDSFIDMNSFKDNQSISSLDLNSGIFNSLDFTLLKRLFPKLKKLTILSSHINTLDFSEIPNDLQLSLNNAKIKTIKTKSQLNAPENCKIKIDKSTTIPTGEVQKIKAFFQPTKWQKLKQFTYHTTNHLANNHKSYTPYLKAFFSSLFLPAAATIGGGNNFFKNWLYITVPFGVFFNKDHPDLMVGLMILFGCYFQSHLLYTTYALSQPNWWEVGPSLTNRPKEYLKSFKFSPSWVVTVEK